MSNQTTPFGSPATSLVPLQDTCTASFYLKSQGESHVAEGRTWYSKMPCSVAQKFFQMLSSNQRFESYSHPRECLSRPIHLVEDLKLIEGGDCQFDVKAQEPSLAAARTMLFMESRVSILETGGNPAKYKSRFS